MNLLGRESVYSGHFDNEWREISQKIENSKQTVDELFLNKLISGGMFWVVNYLKLTLVFQTMN